MKLTDAEVAARLAANPEDDVCVLRIEDGDYGCEEILEPPMLWLLVQNARGDKFSWDLPESRVTELGLTEGCPCQRGDLHA